MPHTNGGERPRAKPYGITDMRVTDDGVSLLIVIDLTGETQPSAQGKSEMLASTRGLVQVAHPEFPGLWASVNVGYEAAEYAALKAAKREISAKIRALTRPGTEVKQQA